MRIDLDARVKTADGHDAGHVRRALIDPAAQRVTGFVVGTGGLLEREVIVGEDDFVPDSPEGDALVLRLSRQELEAQPTFEQGNFAPPPAGWAATMGSGFPSNASLMPVATAADFVREPQRPSLQNGGIVEGRDRRARRVLQDRALRGRANQAPGFV